MEKLEKNKADRGRTAVRAISAAILIAGLAVFGYWCAVSEGVTVKAVAVAMVALGMFVLALVIAVPRAVRFFGGVPDPVRDPLGPRSGRRRGFTRALGIIAAVLLARVAVIATAYVFGRVFRNVQGSIISMLEDIWLKLDTDAPHYFSIAENWYTTEAPQMYELVFPPFFPLLIRALNLVLGDSFTSAMVINTVCSCASGAVLWRLAAQDMGRRSSRIAVIFAFALPAAVFFVAPMSEALFFLLSISTLLALRKGRFWLAAVLGALACFTRLPGIIMIVPFIAEGVRYAVMKRAEGGRGKARVVIKLLLCLLVFCLGSFGYLLINKLIWGDWFKFVEFQRDVWYQQPAFFCGTAAMQTDQLFLSFGNRADLLGLWLPNLLYIFGALAVLVASARTLRTSYTLYFAAYLAITCGASWLLSAPRYLTALAVLPIALAHLCEGRDDGAALGRARAKTAIVTAALTAGQVCYLLMYVIEYSIY